MAIVGTFEADFSQFTSAVRGAETQLRSLEVGTTKVATSVDQVGNLLAGLGRAFGITFTAAAVVQFGTDLFNATSRLQELSQATGVSTDAIQQMSFVMTEFGVDTETIARAVGTLSARIGSGNAGVTQAVEDLGLSVAKLQQMAPEEAFLAFAEAAGRLENPITKADIVSTALGDRLARVLIPALGDLRTAMDAVPKDAIISAETIANANKFDATLKQLYITFKATIVEGISADLKLLAKAWDLITPSFDQVGTSAAAAGDGLALMASHTPELKLMSSHGIQPLISDADIMRQRLEEWRTEGLEPLNEEQKKAIALGNEKHKSDALIAETIGVSVEAVRRYVAILKEQTAEQDKLKASIDRLIASQSTYLDLLPMQPKDVEIDFQPTGAYKMILDQATAEREHAEALALVEEQMKENFLIIGQTTQAHAESGEAAKAGTDKAAAGYGLLASSIGQATQQVDRFAVSQRQMMELGEAARQFNRGTSTTTQEALLKGFEIVTARGGAPATAGGGGGTVINVNAQGATFDTPEGQQRFFERVDSAIETKLRSLGRQVA